MSIKLWLFQVNNITNTLNPRYRSIVSGAWTEFVLMVKDVRPRDSGTYECQVMSMKIVLSDRSSLHCAPQLVSSTIFLDFQSVQSPYYTYGHYYRISATHFRMQLSQTMMMIWSGVRAKTLQSPSHSTPHCDWSVRIIVILFTPR